MKTSQRNMPKSMIKQMTIILAFFVMNIGGFSQAPSNWQLTGSNITNLNTGNVGIGVTTPGFKLDVQPGTASPDGINISNSLGEAILNLENTNGGDLWTFHSLDTPGPDFLLDNGSATAIFYIDGGNGNVGIGTASPGDPLTVAGNVVPDVDNAYTCGKSALRWSALWATNGTIQTSDLRKKKDIADINYGINEILKLRPVSYRWKEKDDRVHLGLIAQELREIIKEVVYDGEDENQSLGVAYSDLIPVLISGVQDQQRQIEELEEKINILVEKMELSAGMVTKNGLNLNLNLEQNIPNPFTHETLIKYSLPAQINSAYMAVYDLTGKQITSYVLDQKNSTSITITSEKLAAGIYIYSIIADGTILDSKRMIVADK